MRAIAVFAAASSLALASCAATMTDDSVAGTAAAEAGIAAAVADPARSAENRALDEGRKPAETLAFLGLRPGMDAVDIFTGGGYWAEIMARAVAPGGSVVAYEPTQFYNGKGKETLDALIAASPSAACGRFRSRASPRPRTRSISR